MCIVMKFHTYHGSISDSKIITVYFMNNGAQTLSVNLRRML